MIEVYILTGRGVLHKGVLKDGRVLSDERDNLDDARSRSTYESFEIAERESKRLCTRCFAPRILLDPDHDPDAA